MRCVAPVCATQPSLGRRLASSSPACASIPRVRRGGSTRASSRALTRAARCSAGHGVACESRRCFRMSCSRRHTALSLPRSVRRRRHRHRHPAGLRHLNWRDVRPPRLAPWRTTTSPSIRRPRLRSGCLPSSRRSAMRLCGRSYPRLIRSATRDDSDGSDSSRVVTRHRRRRTPPPCDTVVAVTVESDLPSGADIGSSRDASPPASREGGRVLGRRRLYAAAILRAGCPASISPLVHAFRDQVCADTIAPGSWGVLFRTPANSGGHALAGGHRRLPTCVSP